MARYWPMRAGDFNLGSLFGPRWGEMHLGIDLEAPYDAHIYAAQGGVVEHIGYADGFGQWIVIDHPTEAGSGATVYGHMADAFATGLQLGDWVEAGQHIAFVGSNGNSTGPHLHFEVHPYSWARGSQIDPLPWLAGAPYPGGPPIAEFRGVAPLRVTDPASRRFHGVTPLRVAGPTSPRVSAALQPTAAALTDTIYADVSEHQVAVDDSYPYRVIAIRSNDGDYRDLNWDQNYDWCRRKCDEGALDFFIVYFVWYPNWEVGVATIKDMVSEPHPRMAVMIDVESWEGKITGDQSEGLNAAYWNLAQWLGDPRRVIGYGTAGDLNSLWPDRPGGLGIVLAAWGFNPDYPGKIAHQYTDNHGYGNGDSLPNGSLPFGPCDMNSADGRNPAEFAAACGIDVYAVPETVATFDRNRVLMLDSPRRVVPRSVYSSDINDTAVERNALLGDPDAVELVTKCAESSQDGKARARAELILTRLQQLVGQPTPEKRPAGKSRENSSKKPPNDDQPRSRGRRT
ncbi:M23 family metallopeptidase [Mycobacterium sp. SMC-17]|uniref:M23 family metallopeptidase n=1 Tax=Mycobacterium sp. SMC-17 TaxID=3381628 RepID=UPI00387710E1